MFICTEYKEKTNNYESLRDGINRNNIRFSGKRRRPFLLFALPQRANKRIPHIYYLPAKTSYILNMASESIGIDSGRCYLQNRNIETEYPILYHVDNTIPNVKSLHPCIISCVIEWHLQSVTTHRKECIITDINYMWSAD